MASTLARPDVRWTRLPALLALSLLLAGCASPKATAPTASHTGTQPPTADGLPLPTWAVRDAWTYTIGAAKATYVVTADQGADWMMETDSPERSFQNLRDDVSRLGPQRKSDLAGSQGPDRVVFFEWPLTEGKTWTATWDHQPVTVTAHVAGPAAHLQAKDRNGTVVYDYTYDAAAGWFGSLKHYGTNGTLLIDLELAAHQHNWTGTLARWGLKTIVKQSGTLAGGLDSTMTYDVALNATDVWVSATLSCTSGVVEIGTSPQPFVASATGADPRGGGVSGQPCPSEESMEGSAGAPKAPPQGGTSETWGYLLAASPGSTGSYSFEVLVRTFQGVQFP